MKNYINTFWAPSTYGKSIGVPSYEVYAVVDSYKLNDMDQELIAWRMEVRGVGLFHPEYGLIPRESFSQYNFFIKEGTRTVPNFKFSTKTNKYYYLCNNIVDLTKILFHK